jgi:enoyl-CoA hydratase/carnithine racemase
MIYPKETCTDLSAHRFARLIVKLEAPLLTITLNRPEKKNAMDPVMFRELAYALSCAKHDHRIWAVKLNANGDVFCSGADLKAFAGMEEETDSTIPEPNGEIVIGDVFAQLYKPCVAVVNGPVMAGGFLLICGCTHVVAADTATFRLPEVKRGLWPFQVTASLLNVMTPRAIMNLCMSGEAIGAEEAYRLGLVTHMVAADGLIDVAADLITDLLSNSPTAIRMGLEAFHAMRDMPGHERHAYLKEQLMQCLQTQDAAEGLQAFMQKRPAFWTGQ